VVFLWRSLRDFWRGAWEFSQVDFCRVQLEKSKEELAVSPLSKAMTTLIAINMQVAGLIVAAFWARDYLSQHYPQSFSWDLVVVPLLIVAILHSYYLMIRYLMALNRRMDKK
jgi:putative effector of murein hydrolase